MSTKNTLANKQRAQERAAKKAEKSKARAQSLSETQKCGKHFIIYRRSGNVLNTVAKRATRIAATTQFPDCIIVSSLNTGYKYQNCVIR